MYQKRTMRIWYTLDRLCTRSLNWERSSSSIPIHSSRKILTARSILTFTDQKSSKFDSKFDSQFESSEVLNSYKVQSSGDV